MGFIRSVATTASTNLAIAGITLLTSVLVSRILGPAGRGELAAIQSWPSAIGSIAMLGLPEAVTYYCAKRTLIAGRIIALGMLLAVPTSIAGIAIGTFVLPSLLSEYSNDTVSAAKMYLAIGLVYIAGIPLSALRSTGHFDMWNALRALPTIAWLIILLILVLGPAPHASLLAHSFLAIASVVGLGFVVVTFRIVRGGIRPAFKFAPELISFGLKTWIASAPQTLNVRADQLTLLVLTDPASVGIYTVASAWGNLCSMALSAIGAATFPTIAAAAGPRATEDVGRIVRLAVILAVVVALTLAPLAPIAVPLIFGEAFRGASRIAGLLVFSSTIAALGGILEESLRALGKPGRASIAHLLGAAVTSTLVAIFIGPLGLWGAWLATLIGASITFSYLLVLVSRATGLSIRRVVLPTREDVNALVRAVSRAAHINRL